MRHIRFPFFRNLAPMTQIEFSYPITALVGPNGTNKTSILRAIEGSTDYVGLGNTWFSTDLDPIDSTNRHQVVHGYLSAGYGQIVEAIKIRIRAAGAKSAGKKIDPDYFEPSRPLRSAGMTPMPPLDRYASSNSDRTKTRWKAIDKAVLYLDFRTQISAFDKFFHHGPIGDDESTQQRKDRIRRWSARLALAFSQGLSSDTYFGSERIIEGPTSATENELAAISEILGREYVNLTYVKHKYFKLPGQNSASWTVRMTTANLRYSEAFAGSGEFAAAMLVREVLRAKPKTLILLDEPEVSLHPAAQRAVVKFLTEQVKLRKHQVVFATHSPEMIRELPANAIKTLDLDANTGKVVLVAQETLAQDAFVRLGSTADDHLDIHVEDVLASLIIERALSNMNKDGRSRIQIRIMGGSKRILNHYIPALAKAGITDSIVVLDGDENRGLIPHPDKIPTSSLEHILKTICGGDPSIYADGNRSKGTVNSDGARRELLEWMHSHLVYLPGKSCPEVLLLELSPDEADRHEAKTIGSAAAKALWAKRAAESLGREHPSGASAEEIKFFQEQFLAGIDAEHRMLSELRDTITDLLEQVSSSRKSS